MSCYFNLEGNISFYTYSVNLCITMISSYMNYSKMFFIGRGKSGEGGPCFTMLMVWLIVYNYDLSSYTLLYVFKL